MTDIGHPRLLVTGATGQLGALVLEELAVSLPPARIAVGVRDPAAPAATRLDARGFAVRRIDYRRPETLGPAFAGVERLLFISSNTIGAGRLPEHQAVVEAAAAAGVGFVAYTSVLHADRSPLALAADHRATEQLLASSGLPHAILRNGWYTENYTAFVGAALQHGAVLGAAAAGRIASAARADYAAAAARVLTGGSEHDGRVLELAGDEAYTLTEFAAELSRRAGRTIPYVDRSTEEMRSALEGAGLPGDLAGLLADSDAGAAQGALFDDGRELSRLLGRPTTPLAETLREALPR